VSHATSTIKGIGYGHVRYDDRFEYLGLTSLDRWRIRGDL